MGLLRHMAPPESYRPPGHDGGDGCLLAGRSPPPSAHPTTNEHLVSSVDMNNAPSCEVLTNQLTGTLTLEHAEIQGVNGNDHISGEKWSQKECTGET
jgi:hypothetical protein